MEKVTILERSEGTWSKKEVDDLEKAGADIETETEMPERLVIMKKPITGKTFQQILGHANFESREAEYSDRWE